MNRKFTLIKIALPLFALLAVFACTDKKYDLTNIDNENNVMFQDSLVLPLGETDKIKLDEFDGVDVLSGEMDIELKFGEDNAKRFFSNDKNSLVLSCTIENSLPFDVKFTATPQDKDKNLVPGVIITPTEITLKPSQGGVVSYTKAEISLKGNVDEIAKIANLNLAFTANSGGATSSDGYVKIKMSGKFEGGVKL